MISDHKLQVILKNHIAETNHKKSLKNIYLCGDGIVPIMGQKNVAIMANDNPNDSSIMGVIKCHSTWACPVCTARTMAEKGTDIACLIDALKKWQNRVAVMITFTIPHWANMDAITSLNILKESWHKFTKQGSSKTKSKYELKNNLNERSPKGGKKGVGTKGTIKTYEKGKDPMATFRIELDIKHYVKVIEFTWGKNSWHPHLHVLYFLPKENLSKLLSYESSLNERWTYLTHKITTKKINQEFADKLYERGKKHQSVTISKNPNGLPRIQKSSMYLAGFTGFEKSTWGGDSELTKTSTQIKKAANGHYTPFQLLDEAAKTNDLNERKKFLDLFIEYALATHGIRRVEFSKTKGYNCNEIIKLWKETQDYITSFKKKFMDKAHAPKKMVYWFNTEQWYTICLLEKTTHPDIKSNILTLATKPIKYLENYLKEINPKLIQTKPPNPFWAKFIQQTQSKYIDMKNKMNAA